MDEELLNLRIRTILFFLTQVASFFKYKTRGAKIVSALFVVFSAALVAISIFGGEQEEKKSENM